jgi:hypothetical protein
MDSIFKSFSLYEIFRILIPGLYFTIWLKILKTNAKLTLNLGLTDSEIVTLMIIISIIFGLLFYSWNLNKLIFMFFRNDPLHKVVSRVKKEGISNVRQIRSSYWSFWEELGGDFKEKTEKFSGYFHFVQNFSAINLLILLCFCISLKLNLLEENFYVMTTRILWTCFGIGFLSSFFIYFTRMRDVFYRATEMYFISSSYDRLIEKKNPPEESKLQNASQNK